MIYMICKDHEAGNPKIKVLKHCLHKEGNSPPRSSRLRARESLGPADAPDETIHVVLDATDSGDPALI